MTSQTVGDLTVGVQNMKEEKKYLQRELSTWSKKIPLIVGFEAVAEALLGQEMSFNFLLSTKNKNLDQFFAEDFKGELPVDNFNDSMIDQQSDPDPAISVNDDEVFSDLPLDLRQTEKKIYNPLNGFKMHAIETTPQPSTHPSLNPWFLPQLQSIKKGQSYVNAYYNDGSHSNGIYGNEDLNSRNHSEIESENISSAPGKSQTSKENDKFQFHYAKNNSRNSLSTGSYVSKVTRKHSIAEDDWKSQSWKRKVKSESGEDDDEDSLKFPIEWKVSKKKFETLDFEKTETFKNLEITSSEGSTSAEEGVEPTIDQPSTPLFQMSDKVEHLLMSVITKNILEKYNQVRIGKEDAVSLSDLNANQKLTMIESNQRELSSSVHSSKCLENSRINDLKTSFPSIPRSIQLNNPKSFASFPNVASSNPAAAIKKSRPKRGQYRRYNRQLLLEAVRAVQQGDMSVHRAGSYFGVPHSTLEYKVKERHLLRNKKSNQDQKQRNSNKNIPPHSVQSSHSSQSYSSIASNGHSLSRSLDGNNKYTEFIKNNRTNSDLQNNFRFPFFNDVLRSNGLPLFYSNIFDSMPSPYNWLTPRFSKSPLFPLPYSPSAMLNAFAPLSSGPDFSPASDLLRQFNSKPHSDHSSIKSSIIDPVSIRSFESYDDSSEPHSTSSTEVDLRINRTTPIE